MCGKITLILLACVAAVSATAVSSNGFGCESGVFLNTYRNPPNPLVAKVITDEHKVTFKHKYHGTPAITLGLVKIDNLHARNLRVRAGVKSANNAEMVLFIGKWYYSWLYQASVSYMVCGPLA